MTGASLPGNQKRLNGTARRPYFSSSAAICGFLFVQSARSVTIFFPAKVFNTSSEWKTASLLVWQVAHQRAVKSTYTIRPSARNFSTASGLHGSHTTSGAVVLAFRGFAFSLGAHPTQPPATARTISPATPKRERPADAPGAFQRP